MHGMPSPLLAELSESQLAVAGLTVALEALHCPDRPGPWPIQSAEHGAPSDKDAKAFQVRVQDEAGPGPCGPPASSTLHRASSAWQSESGLRCMHVQQSPEAESHGGRPPRDATQAYLDSRHQG